MVKKHSFENGGTVEALGNIEVALPEYVTMLPQSELTESIAYKHRNRLVVAAGRKLPDDDIVIVTGAGKLMLLRIKGHNVPNGRAVPVDFGNAIAIEGLNYEMAADWAIETAESLGLVDPTYSHEDTIK